MYDFRRLIDRLESRIDRIEKKIDKLFIGIFVLLIGQVLVQRYSDTLSKPLIHAFTFIGALLK